MLKKRIIPLLLLMGQRLVKTINFDKYKDVGNPVSTAKIFNDSDADELILLNIKFVATPDINQINNILQGDKISIMFSRKTEVCALL